MALNSKQKADLKLAKNNASFVAYMITEGNTSPPGMFSSTLDKGIYIAAYFGYLLGKYGSNWEENK